MDNKNYHIFKSGLRCPVVGYSVYDESKLKLPYFCEFELAALQQSN